MYTGTVARSAPNHSLSVTVDDQCIPGDNFSRPAQFQIYAQRVFSLKSGNRSHQGGSYQTGSFQTEQVQSQPL